MPTRPMAAANRISKLLSLVLPEAQRFPIDVKMIALELSKHWCPSEAITQIDAAQIPGFEGLLARHPSGSRWKICYNDQLNSAGRIRFTLAHEFGHYMLHREEQQLFECSEQDMHDWDSRDRRLESEADLFASYLLMPLDDFRLQIGNDPISIDLLLHCADRYGVSVMAAALKWTEIAPKRAVVVAARDGYLLWARSNRAALRSGAYFSTREQTIEVPEKSALFDSVLAQGERSHTQSAQLWFPKEPLNMPLVELVFVSAGSYPYTLGILQLPDAEPRWEQPDDDLLDELDGALRFRR